MEYRKETIVLPAAFPFDMFDAGGQSEPRPVLHVHDCLELNYIAAGRGQNRIEGRVYELRAGDIYIINNLDRHMGSSDGSLLMKVIIFNPNLIWQGGSIDFDYLRPFFQRGVRFANLIPRELPQNAELVRLFGRLEQEWRQRENGYQLFIKALLMEILAILYRHFRSTEPPGADARDFHEAFDRIRGAVDYIHEHFDNDLGLKLLANRVHMNGSYFSTYFKQTMGTNVAAYIQRVRVDLASLLLATTTASVTDICYRTGFASLPHFNRVFKKLRGMTPKEWRCQRKDH
jgi:AraC-like DNA-binding protein